MRFKIDKNLVTVVDAMRIRKPAETVAVELCEHLIAAGWFDDAPINYGALWVEVVAPVYVADACSLLSEYLGVAITPDVFSAFSKLRIMGDGNCPSCGGNLRFIETEGHEIPNGNYVQPNDYEIDGYVYECDICSTIFKFENAL